MSSIIDIKTSTNRLLFDLHDVTFMVYHKNRLIIHHINGSATPAYQIDDLSQGQFDDVVDYMNETLLYKPPGSMAPDGAVTLYFASHIQSITIEYSKRPDVPGSLRINYPGNHVILSGDNDEFYNHLWTAMKFAKSHMR